MQANGRRLFPKYFVAIIAALLLALLAIAKTPQANAGSLNNISVSVDNAAKSATTTFNLTFTNSTEIPASSGKINFRIQGPYSYNSSNFNFNGAVVNSSTDPSSIYISDYYWNGLTLKTTSDIAANSTVTIKLDSVANPSTSGYYYVHLWTSNYWNELDGSSDSSKDYNSAYFEITNENNLLTGTVSDSNGNPVPYAYVSLNSSNWTDYYYTYTDVNGKYGIGDINAGSYRFDIYYYGYGSGVNYFSPDSASLTIPAEGTTTKDASFLAADKTISGTVTKDSATGAAVSDGTIYAYRINSSGWVQTTTASNGSYTLNVPAGVWSVYLYPQDYSNATWTYKNDYENIDVTSGNKTKNFVVDSLSATISGSISKDDGTAVGQYDVGLSFNNSKDQWFSATLSSSANNDGSRNFSVKVTPGTYGVSGWSSDSNFSFPSIDNFSVNENQSYSMGSIIMVKKTDTISGTVKDNNGDPVVGASVSAWKSDSSYEWANATSDSSGSYTMLVSPGDWEISAWAPWKEDGYDYVSSGKSEKITVTSGVAATQNFTFQKVTATISGSILNPDTDEPITNLSGWISAGDGSTDWGNVGSSINNGRYTLKVPAGVWTVKVSIWDSNYSNPDSQDVTISDNETKTLNFSLIKNDATITGTVYDENGNKVTGRWMSIYASKGENNSWQSATFNTSTGVFSVNVSAGTWNLGWWIDSSLGYNSGIGQDVEVTISSGETVTQDITLKKIDSIISGTAKDGDGNPIKWAWISADTRDPNEKTTASSYYYGSGESTDSSGEFTLNVPEGTYWVGGNMWYGSGYINPERQKVTVDADSPATVDLIFREADATISGKVTKDDQAVSAFISAWSEDGGYAEANSNNVGNYELNVSSGTTWHLKAKLKSNKDVYISKEHLVDLGSSTSATENLALYKKNYTLPDTQTVTFDPSTQQTIELSDGTTINAPANSITTSSDSVTLTADPDIDLAEESDAKPIAYGYDLSVVDDSGQEIKTFNSNVTIEQTYDETWLEGGEFSTQTITKGSKIVATAASGQVVNENELSPAYYDTSVGTWKILTNATVNENKNTVTYQTNHFTKFALVSATDTTPPSAPSDISATAGDSKITISWTAPSEEDFASINIYRSTTSGSIGEKIYSAITDSSKTDTDLTNGTAYYYTVRAVDTSGNESINTDQVSATPGSSAAASGSVSATSSSTSASSSDAVLPETGRPLPPETNFAALFLLTLILFGLNFRSCFNDL